MKKFDNVSKFLVVTGAINHLASRLQSLQHGLLFSYPESFVIESIDETMEMSLTHLRNCFSSLSTEMEVRENFTDEDIKVISNALEILEPVAQGG
jgi:hypothetical protein